MSNPLAAPMSASATGPLGTTVPVQTATSSSDSALSPQLTTAYNTTSRVQAYINKIKAFVQKHLVWIAIIVGVGLVWFVGPGKATLCTKFGVACDTRPLPGGVREI